MKRTSMFVALVAMAAAGAAQAETAIGRIVDLNAPQHMVTLQNGKTFDFQNATDSKQLEGYRVGDTVAINYDQVGGKLDGNTIQSTATSQEVGVVASINPALHTVTLKNGQTYTFDNTQQATAELQGYKVGDKVQISYDTQGDKLWGQAISGTEADQMVGILKMIDAPQGKVTLQDGQTYALVDPSHGDAVLDGYKPGDKVALMLVPVGDATVIETITPVTN